MKTSVKCDPGPEHPPILKVQYNRTFQLFLIMEPIYGVAKGERPSGKDGTLK